MDPGQSAEPVETHEAPVSAAESMPPAEATAPISERIGEPLPEMLPETYPGEAEPETAPEPGESEPATGEVEETREPLRPPAREAIAREPQPYRPAPPARRDESAISEAIQKVLFIMKELKESMEEMEHVLELLEEAERQQLTDDREIRNLRKALESLHRGRGPAEHPRRQQHEHR